MKSFSHGDSSALLQPNQTMPSMYGYQGRIGNGRESICVIEVIS